MVVSPPKYGVVNAAFVNNPVVGVHVPSANEGAVYVIAISQFTKVPSSPKPKSAIANFQLPFNVVNNAGQSVAV